MEAIAVAMLRQTRNEGDPDVHITWRLVARLAPIGAATSLNYAITGLVDWPVAVLFIAGGVVGGILGLRGARALAVRAVLARRLFVGLILAVAVYVGWRAVSG